MMKTVLFVVRKATLVTNALRHSAITVMISAIVLQTAPSGTPHHHNRSHCHSCSNHGHRNRSHSFHHRCSQGNCFDRSRSHHWPQSNRSSSHHQGHASHSISHHNSHSHYPSTDRYTGRHFHRDTLHQHRQNTSSHPSCWNLSWHYSTDHSQSSFRNSSGTTYGLHTKKVSKPHSWRENPHRAQNKKVGHYWGLTNGFFFGIG